MTHIDWTGQMETITCPSVLGKKERSTFECENKANSKPRCRHRAVTERELSALASQLFALLTSYCFCVAQPREANFWKSVLRGNASLMRTKLNPVNFSVDFCAEIRFSKPNFQVSFFHLTHSISRLSFFDLNVQVFFSEPPGIWNST